MKGKQVDYDRIAPTYNQRFSAGNEMEGIARSLLALVQEFTEPRILEVGCGTGHWLSSLASSSPRLHGLDLSPGMLHQSQQAAVDLLLACGRANQLPYPDASFDLVYCVNAIHHFQQKHAFVSEAFRLLAPGGVLAIVGSDPHTNSHNWYVYEHFQGTLDADLDRFPSWGQVLDWMLASGFRQVQLLPVDEIHDPKFGQAVWDDPFLQKNACSQLALLNDEDYAAGLNSIKSALARAETRAEILVFATDIYRQMLVGKTPTRSAPTA